MPIIIHKDIVYLVSRVEFLEEYKGINTVDKPITEITKSKDFDFTKSVLAITESYKNGKDRHANDLNKRLYAFNYFEKDAQDIVEELLVLFSSFYCKFKIFDNQNNLQPIEEYLLPHKNIRFQQKSNITISYRKLDYRLDISQIRQIKGLVNNFVIFLDNQILHFCSDIRFGKFIKILPFVYEINKDNYFEINDFDYVFDRNRPNKYKFFNYRKKGFLVIIQ
jgi:hypothetical protein